MKSSLKKILLLMTTSISCIIVAEFAIKLFFPQNLIYHNRDIWRPDSLFGWRHFENANSVVNTGGAGLVHFFSDDNGYRINNINDDTINNMDNPVNVLVLGDSYLEALQVENEETIPQLLKQNISEKYDFDVTFYNSAVGGWNPNHYYLETRRALEKKIDLGIVFLCVANDIVSSIDTSFTPRKHHKRHKLKIPKGFSFSDFKQSIFYPVNDFIEVRSHLFIFLKQKFATTLSKVGLTATNFPIIFFLEEKTSNRWEITSQICNNIYVEFSNSNIPVIFVLLPTSYQCDEKVFYKYAKGFHVPLDSIDLEQPNKLLAKSLKERAIHLYDPLDFMRKKTENGETLYGWVDFHFTAEGHRAMAEYLLPIIVDTLKIKGDNILEF